MLAATESRGSNNTAVRADGRARVQLRAFSLQHRTSVVNAQLHSLTLFIHIILSRNRSTCCQVQNAIASATHHQCEMFRIYAGLVGDRSMFAEVMCPAVFPTSQTQRRLLCSSSHPFSHSPSHAPHRPLRNGYFLRVSASSSSSFFGPDFARDPLSAPILREPWRSAVTAAEGRHARLVAPAKAAATVESPRAS